MHPELGCIASYIYEEQHVHVFLEYPRELPIFLSISRRTNYDTNKHRMGTKVTNPISRLQLAKLNLPGISKSSPNEFPILCFWKKMKKKPLQQFPRSIPHPLTIPKPPPSARIYAHRDFFPILILHRLLPVFFLGLAPREGRRKGGRRRAGEQGASGEGEAEGGSVEGARPLPPAALPQGQAAQGSSSQATSCRHPASSRHPALLDTEDRR